MGKERYFVCKGGNIKNEYIFSYFSDGGIFSGNFHFRLQ
jgi:hypothetical protein